MNYKEMIKDAKASGKWDSKMAMASMESVADLLECVKKADEQAYWNFLRTQAGIINGNHYCEAFACYDVSQMGYTDREGKKHKGGYWTCEEIEEKTKGMNFPSGVTKWDKFVAFNGFHADTCKVLDCEQIIKAAFQFFFADEDWCESGSASKTWEYFSCKYGK